MSYLSELHTIRRVIGSELFSRYLDIHSQEERVKEIDQALRQFAARAKAGQFQPTEEERTMMFVLLLCSDEIEEWRNMCLVGKRVAGALIHQYGGRVTVPRKQITEMRWKIATEDIPEDEELVVFTAAAQEEEGEGENRET